MIVMKGGREGEKKKERERKEEGREGRREGRREGKREGKREEGKEGGRERGRKGGREGRRIYNVCMYIRTCTCTCSRCIYSTCPQVHSAKMLENGDFFSGLPVSTSAVSSTHTLLSLLLSSSPPTSHNYTVMNIIIIICYMYTYINSIESKVHGMCHV